MRVERQIARPHQPPPPIHLPCTAAMVDFMTILVSSISSPAAKVVLRLTPHP